MDFVTPLKETYRRGNWSLNGRVRSRSLWEQPSMEWIGTEQWLWVRNDFDQNNL